MKFASFSDVECYSFAPSNNGIAPRDLHQFKYNDIFPLSKNLRSVCNYTPVQILTEVLSMLIVTQLNKTSDNNLHISFHSAVPVLCCCTKYQQMTKAVLLHQISLFVTSLRSVDRTNLISSTDRPQPGGLLGGSYRRYLSDKIMCVFPKYRQLIHHTDCNKNCCCGVGN